ncbi:hypothetical protein L107_09126 [Cyanobium sp. Copco_Reservoir_LC18]|uniref:hypothetical protein n=1 Tax=Cyanobium sp. Copco_Reservoir_LC18 TaxID=1328305 RepID=UPI0016A8326E|nr:hypothetical protein [Cyanobium sp. Copco_Reservoir_LC18]KAF0653304.1 hypothetical protein L107_09126 [Cyanobium sp. Copco_Reservoir_LC18]
MNGASRGGPTPVVAALLALLLLVGCWLAGPAAAMAGPVDWQEVEAGPEGRQWWDAGSLRFDREGRLSVLSRFQPAAAADAPEDARPPVGQLYVMQLDCDEELYRDTAVNGLPRWGATWQPAAGDNLTIRVLHAACDAARRPRESDATA